MFAAPDTSDDVGRRKAERAETAIALVKQAAQRNREMPGRTGALLELPSEGEVLVAGDLHGNRGNFYRLVELAHLQRHRHRHLVVQEVVHTLVSGEDLDQSWQLVEMAARTKTIFPAQFHYLLGNHEFAEVLDLEVGRRGRGMNAGFADGLRAAYGEQWREVRAAYCEFWRSCPIVIHTPNRLFIGHATPRLNKIDGLDLEYLRNVEEEEIFRRHSPVFNMVWGRDYRPEVADTFAEKMDADLLIVGHTPCDNGVNAPNHRHVVLDTTSMDGKCALLPLGKPLSQMAALKRVRRLYGQAE